jgi:DNA-binding CsgD family transcriptional regulator
MSTPAHGRGANGSQVPSQAGLVLVDCSQKPVYYNAEAVRILTYPKRLDKLGSLRGSLPKEIQILLWRPGQNDELRMPEFVSGRRHYICRAFALTQDLGTPARTITGLLLERTAPKSVSLCQIAEQFHLTQREQETVGLLTLGLTSKEIATRMNISPNTVKAFFRLVMTKMAVSTRSGIVGKIARM